MRYRHFFLLLLVVLVSWVAAACGSESPVVPIPDDDPDWEQLSTSTYEFDSCELTITISYHWGGAQVKVQSSVNGDPCDPKSVRHKANVNWVSNNPDIEYNPNGLGAWVSYHNCEHNGQGVFEVSYWPYSYQTGFPSAIGTKGFTCSNTPT